MRRTISDVDFLPISKVKPRLSEFLSNVAKTKRGLAITCDGVPKCILLDYEEFIRMIEMLEISDEFRSTP